MIDPLELRLLASPIGAHGSPEMPDPDLLDEVVHVLKGQVAVNTDLRDESELFFEYLATKDKAYAALVDQAATTNDETFAWSDGLKSPLRGT